MTTRHLGCFFNVIEGIIDHQLLGLHHVHEYVDDKLPWDLAFLAFGALQLLHEESS